jgi:hypothetical protein
MTVPPHIEKKRLLLGGALLLTVGASVWLGLENDTADDTVDVVQVVKPKATPKHDAHHKMPAFSLPILAKTQDRDASGNNTADKQSKVADMFKSHTWYVPPPPPTHSTREQAIAAPPEPPPLPFTYLGIVEDDGHKVVFLAREQRLYTVSKGEVFDGQYRLEGESKGRIEIVYLPLNVKQILVIKGAS